MAHAEAVNQPMTQKRLMSITVLLLAVSLFATAAIAHGDGDSDNHEHAMDANSDLGEVRQATARYHDPEAAEADGYLLDREHCVPGMGYHALNPARLTDGELDPTQPEILVYAPSADGEDLRLVAVEYGLLPAHADGTPELFGQAFDEPHAVPFYTLHAWIWQGNPDGLFNAINPNVNCPDSGEEH